MKKFSEGEQKVKASTYPPITNYVALKKKYLTLATRGGYGMRMKHPRHPLVVSTIARNFPEVESIIDLETIGSGEFMYMLANGSEGIERQLENGDKKKDRLRPIKTVHATYWLYSENGGFIKRLCENPKSGMDLKCFPYSYQELNKIPDRSYDVALSINVLDHLTRWEDVRAAIEQILRIAKVGAIFLTDTSAKEKVAWAVQMRQIQYIGLVRSEWDDLFKEFGATPEGEGIYVWSRSTKRGRPGKSTSRNKRATREVGRKRRGRPKKSEEQTRQSDPDSGGWEICIEPPESSSCGEDQRGSSGRTGEELGEKP